MPGSEPVTAVANAVTEIAGALRPFINEKLAQRYAAEANERIQSISWTAAHGSADALCDAVDRLCADAGFPTGLVSGKGITIRLEHFNALVAATVNAIKLGKQLASIEFKVTQTR